MFAALAARVRPVCRTALRKPQGLAGARRRWAQPPRSRSMQLGPPPDNRSDIGVLGLGVIGSEIAKQAAEKGMSVVTADIDTRREINGLPFIPINMNHPKSVYRFMRHCKTVYLLAAMLSTETDALRIAELNFIAHIAALESAQQLRQNTRLDTTIVAPSSVAVYGYEGLCRPDVTRTQSFDHNIRPRTLYGHFKLALELAMTAHRFQGLNVIGIRVPGVASRVVGGKGSTEWLTDLVGAAVQGEDRVTIPVSLSGRVAYSHIHDVARAFIEIPTADTTHLAHPTMARLNLPGYEISAYKAKRVLRQHGYRIKIDHQIGREDDNIRSWPLNLGGEIVRSLGFTPTYDSGEKIITQMIKDFETEQSTTG